MIKLEKGESYREEKICGGVLFYRNDPLEKWKCRVRMKNGEVVEAVYEGESECGLKTHLVYCGNMWAERTSSKALDGHCRFIGNPCVLLPVGVSV